jgi:hypothetical protein
MIKEKLGIPIIFLILTSSLFLGGTGFPLLWNDINENIYTLSEDNSNLHTINQDISNIHPINQDLSDINNSSLYKSIQKKYSDKIEYIMVKDSTGRIKSIIVTY